MRAISPDDIRTVLESTAGGVLVADTGRRRFLFANSTICQLLGYTRDEIRSLGVEDIHPPDDLPWILADFEAQAQGLKILAKDVPCRRKGGSLVYCDISTTSRFIGGVQCNIGYFLDITERRQAEEALRESERQHRETKELLEAVLNAIPDVIGVQDPDHNIIRYNEAGYRFLGSNPEDVVGKKCYELVGRRHPCSECATSMAVASGVVAQIERHVPELGCWLDCRSYPVLNERGEVFRIVEHLRDITEHRRMEEQLRHSEKMQAIGQLAGGVAHDFNNQLSGILGLAELLRSEVAESPELVDLVDGIQASVERASNLTSQLLAFARQGKYRSVPVDLHCLITEITGLLGRSIHKKIRIRHRLTAKPSTTLGDPTQLLSAILNLAINARDAMPDGGELLFETTVVSLDAAYCASQPYYVPRHDSRLPLSSQVTRNVPLVAAPVPRHEIQPGEYVQVSVSDTGVGIPPETREHIFEPFFTTKERGKGTGMGLAAVYGTVKSHRGAITVYSEPGRGTTMKLYLPLLRGEEEDAPTRDPEPLPGGRQGRILLVDDEEILLTTAKAMLTRLGYSVISCHNGAEALEIYREEWASIDLVILDMVMPIMAGKETFEAMHEINPGIKAVLASGYSLNGEAQSILDRGVKAFLQKPFRLAELGRVVARALAGN